MKKSLAVLTAVIVMLTVTVAFWFATQKTVVAEDAYTTHHPAYLCSSCAFGNKKDNCCVCGKWCGSTKVPARLCDSCGFGNKGDDCVVCGKWCGSSKTPAVMCSSCGFGNKKSNCCRCGKWAP